MQTDPASETNKRAVNDSLPGKAKVEAEVVKRLLSLVSSFIMVALSFALEKSLFYVATYSPSTNPTIVSKNVLWVPTLLSLFALDQNERHL